MPAALVLFMAALAAMSPDALRPRVELVPVLEQGVSLQHDDLDAVSAGVRRIWRRGVDLVMREPTSDGAVNTESIRVVFTHRTLGASGNEALAWVEFVDGEPQPLLTVSVTAVASLARGGSWMGRSFESLPPRARQEFMRRALTHAVAHEVGHYLFKTPTHTRRGLMQASFTVDEIMDPASPLDRLAPDDLARLGPRAPAVARDDGLTGAP
jgi:hypothetical protein